MLRAMAEATPDTSFDSDGVEERETVRKGWWEKNETENMVTITSIQQFVDLLASAGDRLVIVEFFGTWCGACKGVYPKLCKILEEHPDVILAKVDFDSNKPIAKAMGVRVLPYFMFYRGADGRLDAFSASLSKVHKLREAIEAHTSPRCQLGEAKGAEEFADFFKPRVRPLGDLMVSRVEPREGAPQSNPAAGKVRADHLTRGANAA